MFAKLDSQVGLDKFMGLAIPERELASNEEIPQPMRRRAVIADTGSGLTPAYYDFLARSSLSCKSSVEQSSEFVGAFSPSSDRTGRVAVEDVRGLRDQMRVAQCSSSSIVDRSAGLIGAVRVSVNPREPV